MTKRGQRRNKETNGKGEELSKGLQTQCQITSGTEGSVVATFGGQSIHSAAAQASTLLTPPPITSGHEKGYGVSGDAAGLSKAQPASRVVPTLPAHPVQPVVVQVMNPAAPGAEASQSTRPAPTPSPTPRESSGNSAITPRRDSKRSADSRPPLEKSAKRITRESIDSQSQLSDRGNRYDLAQYSLRTYTDFGPPPHGGPSPSASFRSLPGLRHQSWAQLAELGGVERSSFTSQVGESGIHRLAGHPHSGMSDVVAPYSSFTSQQSGSSCSVAGRFSSTQQQLGMVERRHALLPVETSPLQREFLQIWNASGDGPGVDPREWSRMGVPEQHVGLGQHSNLGLQLGLGVLGSAHGGVSQAQQQALEDRAAAPKRWRGESAGPSPSSRLGHRPRTPERMAPPYQPLMSGLFGAGGGAASASNEPQGLVSRMPLRLGRKYRAPPRAPRQHTQDELYEQQKYKEALLQQAVEQLAGSSGEAALRNQFAQLQQAAEMGGAEPTALDAITARDLGLSARDLAQDPVLARQTLSASAGVHGHGNLPPSLSGGLGGVTGVDGAGVPSLPHAPSDPTFVMQQRFRRAQLMEKLQQEQKLQHQQQEKAYEAELLRRQQQAHQQQQQFQLLSQVSMAQMDAPGVAQGANLSATQHDLLSAFQALQTGPPPTRQRRPLRAPGHRAYRPPSPKERAFHAQQHMLGGGLQVAPNPPRAWDMEHLAATHEQLDPAAQMLGEGDRGHLLDSYHIVTQVGRGLSHINATSLPNDGLPAITSPFAAAAKLSNPQDLSAVPESQLFSALLDSRTHSHSQRHQNNPRAEVLSSPEDHLIAAVRDGRVGPSPSDIDLDAGMQQGLPDAAGQMVDALDLVSFEPTHVAHGDLHHHHALSHLQHLGQPHPGPHMHGQAVLEGVERTHLSSSHATQRSKSERVVLDNALAKMIDQKLELRTKGMATDSELDTRGGDARGWKGGREGSGMESRPVEEGGDPGPLHQYSANGTDPFVSGDFEEMLFDKDPTLQGLLPG